MGRSYTLHSRNGVTRTSTFLIVENLAGSDGYSSRISLMDITQNPRTMFHAPKPQVKFSNSSNRSVMHSFPRISQYWSVACPHRLTSTRGAGSCSGEGDMSSSTWYMIGEQNSA